MARSPCLAQCKRQFSTIRFLLICPEQKNDIDLMSCEVRVCCYHLVAM